MDTDIRAGRVSIGEATAADGEAIAAIHAEGLASGHASFRDTAYDWQHWSEEYPVRCVARLDGRVAGWAGVAPVSSRCTYAGVGEVSVYLARAAAGQGIGRRLMAALIERAEAAGYWTLVAQMFPENEVSRRLHEHAGFRFVGRRERLGRMTYGPMSGQWRDVIWLERRSDRVGAD